MCCLNAHPVWAQQINFSDSVYTTSASAGSSIGFDTTDTTVVPDRSMSSGTSGDSGHTTSSTGQGPRGMGGWLYDSYPTAKQQSVWLRTGTLGIAPAFGTRGRNSLPPCTMDSFVFEAKEHAEHIYGDEGTEGPPPYFGFTKAHRINTGIMEMRDRGLTTGRGSLMPDAWGGDEFIGAEFTRSGARSGATPIPVYTATRVSAPVTGATRSVPRRVPYIDSPRNPAINPEFAF